MKYTAIALLAALTFAIGACHCGETKSAECTEVKPGIVTSVNKFCAVEHEDPVDPAITPVQKVGFCCAGCTKKWAKMTDAQREATLKVAMAKQK
jgi:hypothetical protein